MALHKHGGRVASAAGQQDPAFETLERIANNGPWVRSNGSLTAV
jgi:hypothetical protein